MSITAAQDVIAVCSDLKSYWAPRARKFEQWYQQIEMVDLLKTEKMESFVGNDPRSMFNLVLHLLDQQIPHRVRDMDKMDMATQKAAAELGDGLDMIWRKNQRRFRKSGPFMTEQRQFIALLLATGWYARFAILNDNGEAAYIEPWNPAEVFPMWYHGGLSECAHVFEVPLKATHAMMQRNGWATKDRLSGSQVVYDYWYLMEGDIFPFAPVVWNAVVIGTHLVKNEPTRFSKIPIYTAPVGGLPDTGVLSRNARLSTSFSAGNQKAGERWKEEIGQAIIATNEHIYNTWNKWWTYGLQLLRDTAQPRIFERSQSNKAIVKPEDIWRRGAIFRGGPNDSVEFLQTPTIPLELRQNQIDLEAMMQRGGVSWSMFGDMKTKMTTFMMSQVAASANQIMKPFHQAIINSTQDINEDFVEDMQERGVKPHGFALPSGLPQDMEFDCTYEIKIPGEIIQKATVSRMLDPDWRMPSSYVMKNLWPDVKDVVQYEADIQADAAKRHPMNAVLALIQTYKEWAQYMAVVVKDSEAAKLFTAAAETVAAQAGLAGGAPAGGPAAPQRPPLLPEGTRTDVVQTPGAAKPIPAQVR